MGRVEIYASLPPGHLSLVLCDGCMHRRRTRCLSYLVLLQLLLRLLLSFLLRLLPTTPPHYHAPHHTIPLHITPHHTAPHQTIPHPTQHATPRQTHHTPQNTKTQTAPEESVTDEGDAYDEVEEDEKYDSVHDTDSEEEYNSTDETGQLKTETEQWTNWKKRQYDRILTEHERKHKKIKEKQITLPQIKKHTIQIKDTHLVTTTTRHSTQDQQKESKWDEAIPDTVKRNPILHWLYKDGPMKWRRKLHDNHTEPEGTRTNKILQCTDAALRAAWRCFASNVYKYTPTQDTGSLHETENGLN
jgi:hypothetical protein